MDGEMKGMDVIALQETNMNGIRKPEVRTMRQDYFNVRGSMKKGERQEGWSRSAGV